MSLDPITAVLDVGGKILDKIFPDKTQAEAAKLQLTTLAQTGHLEEIKLWFADIQGARQREMEIVKATGSKDINLYVLAWAMVAGFFALLGFLLFVPVPADQSGVVFMLFGALSSGFGSVIGYFFGSSKGSSDKTQELKALLEKK